MDLFGTYIGILSLIGFITGIYIIFLYRADAFPLKDGGTRYKPSRSMVWSMGIFIVSALIVLLSVWGFCTIDSYRKGYFPDVWIFGIASVITLIAIPLVTRYQIRRYSAHSVSYLPTHVEVIDSAGRLRIINYSDVSRIVPYTPSKWSFAPKIGWQVISHNNTCLAIVFKPIPMDPLAQGRFIPYLYRNTTWRISVK